MHVTFICHIYTWILATVFISRNFCAAGQSIFLKPEPALTIYIRCNVCRYERKRNERSTREKINYVWRNWLPQDNNYCLSLSWQLRDLQQCGRNFSCPEIKILVPEKWNFNKLNGNHFTLSILLQKDCAW